MEDKSVQDNLDIDKIFCKRCGRVLRDFHSREIGYGPNCFKQMREEITKKSALFEIGGDSNE